MQIKTTHTLPGGTLDLFIDGGAFGNLRVDGFHFSFALVNGSLQTALIGGPQGFVGSRRSRALAAAKRIATAALDAHVTPEWRAAHVALYAE